MDDNLNFAVQVLNSTNRDEFEEAFKSRLNNGYTLGSSNTCFDNNGIQYYYAVFYYQVPGNTGETDLSSVGDFTI